MNPLHSILASLGAVLALVVIAVLGAGAMGLHAIFGVVIPYLAVVTFIAGVIYRVVTWARSPVPFRITTTCGQQKSLPWIQANELESPSSALGVLGRMALEVLLFRSLFRNTKAELKAGPKLVYGHAKWLWLAGLAFHWIFLVIVVRHFRFFLEPVPTPIRWLEAADSFFNIGVPALYVTDVVFLAAACFLFLRRVVIPQMRYLSLPADYFAILLIIAIAASGVDLRYFARTDVASVKELAVGIVSFRPTVPDGIAVTFYVHLFLVCCLLAYFPFSKLMHLGGVFLSPTRNLPNDNRVTRHVNPWDYPVEVHTYEEYEDEFRDKMVAAGIPVDKAEAPEAQE